MTIKANILIMITTTQIITELLQESTFTFDSYNNVAYLTSIPENGDETGIEANLDFDSLNFECQICIKGEYFISDEYEQQVYGFIYDMSQEEIQSISDFVSSFETPTHLNHPATI